VLQNSSVLSSLEIPEVEDRLNNPETLFARHVGGSNILALNLFQRYCENELELERNTIYSNEHLEEIITICDKISKVQGIENPSMDAIEELKIDNKKSFERLSEIFEMTSMMRGD